MNNVIHRSHRLTGVAWVLALATSAILSIASAGPPEFDLSWHTLDGGGGLSTGGGFALLGTIGQPDAGSMAGGGFSLAGGFWAASTTELPCIADLTGDSSVGPSDLANLLAAWGTNPGGPPDFNVSGNVGPDDLGTLLASWGQCP